MTRDIYSSRPGIRDFYRESIEFGDRRAREKMERDLLKAQAEQYRARAQAALDPRVLQSQKPAAVREFEAYSQLSPKQQREYKALKRAPIEDYLMRQGMVPAGMDAQVVPMGGFAEALARQKALQTRAVQEQKGLTEPDIQGDIVRRRLEEERALKPKITLAQEEAKFKAQRVNELRELEATLPQLEKTVSKLSKLGKKATYTKGGQLRDILKRESGGPVGEGAIARKEYISLVDNQILPLLRQTFGAQFTEREGQTLRATLGDADASPEEKDAVLRSFIEQKKESIKSLGRQIDPNAAQAELPQDVQPVEVMESEVDESSSEQGDVYEAARQAIKDGAPRIKVQKRLIEMGFDPRGI